MKLDLVSGQPCPCDQLPREPGAKAQASSLVGKILCIWSHIVDIGGSQCCPLGEDNRDPAPHTSSLCQSRPASFCCNEPYP